MADGLTFWIKDDVFTSEIRAIYRLSVRGLDQWSRDGWAATYRDTTYTFTRNRMLGEVDLTEVDEATAMDLARRTTTGGPSVLGAWAFGGEYSPGFATRRSPLLPPD